MNKQMSNNMCFM